MTSLLKQPYTRRTLMAAVLSSSLVPAVRADYQAEVLSENPLIYYRFDDAVATDDLASPAANLGSLGTAANGGYTGGFARGVAGALAGSANTAVAGAGNLVEIPFNAALNSAGSFSMELWLKPATIPATGALISPVGSFRESAGVAGDATFGRRGWLIYQGDAATGFNFRTYNRNTTSTAVSINSGEGITVGAWHHVVVTWDSVASVGKIYVNGVLKRTSPVITPGGEESTTFVPNNVSPLALGSRGGGALPWNGSIDEPAYYTSVLSDAQVLARYNNGIDPAPAATYDSVVLADAPAGYWRLGEAAFVPRTPPVATNAGSLGAAANGGYFAGSKNVATGPSPSSGFLGFGAGNSSLGLATANGHVGTPFQLDGLSTFTVMGWVKRGAVKSTRGGYFGQNDKLEFGDAGGGAQIEAWSAPGAINVTNPFLDDQWGFIAYVANGTDNRMYFNGEQVGSPVTGAQGGTAPLYFFNIGGGGIFTPSADYFRGEIDEVAVFNKAVTPARVKQLYDAALGNVAPGLISPFPTVSVTGDIPEGQPYTLSIAEPTGTPPFTYQWKLNGVDIPLATGRTYTVPSAAANSPDPLAPLLYSVVVSNGNLPPVTSEALEVFVTPSLRWTSTDAVNPGKWDRNTLSPSPLNWAKFTGGAAAAYTDAFAVVFDDSATATAVALTQDHEPAGIVFNNNTKEYTLSGPFIISGSFGAGLVKNGTGTAVIGNDILNMESVTVNDGVLRIGNGTTGEISAIAAVKVNGGELELNLASGVPYTSPTVVSGGLISFTGAGNFSTSANISGAGNQLFNGTGTVVVAGPNALGGTVTLDSGTVVFDGNQEANRLAVGKLVTVNPGATMEIRGVNALPTGLNSVSPQLNQSTLKVISGFSAGAPAAGSHAHLRNLVLDGGSIVLGYSGTGGVYNGESFQLNGDISVTGTAPSTIANDGTANAGNSGIAFSSGATEVIHTVSVADVAAGADLIVTTELENSDSGTPQNAVMAKTGAGTLRLAGGISHTFSGTTRINEGTVEATGSLAGPLVIGSSGTIAPGINAGTFAAGATTLSGKYACEIDGALSDKLVVNGSLTLSPGAQIAFSTLGAASAPFYEIASCTGGISGPLPTVTGAPAGYTLSIVSSSSLVLAQAGLAVQPTIGPAVSSGSENFNTTSGGFRISAPVTAETDWAHTPGSWRSSGQASAFGADNTSYLLSPIYTVTQAGAVTLSFNHRFSFEADFDGGAVDVSVNGGPFTRVATPSFSQNPYNGTLGAVGHSLQNGEAYVGNSAGHPAFITSVCTLANGQVGDRVQIRFVAAYDNNTVGDLTPVGWEIDSLVVTGGLPSLLTLDWPFGTMQYSDNLLPPWTDVVGKGPLLIDTKLAPRRFFRLKP